MKNTIQKFQDKWKKEDLEKLIFEENKSYLEIGRLYGVSDAYIRKVCSKLCIELPVRNAKNKKKTPHNKGKKKVKKCTCKHCKNEVIMSHPKQKYCSQLCQAKEKRRTKYQHYLANQKDYCKVLSLKFIKPHLLEEQSHQCAICNSPDTWNDKELTFVLDHVDGDASNNMKDNLRLLCPNCDSQLDTFKSRNKNSARKERYLKNYKN